MLEHFKVNSVRINKAEKMTAEELEGKIVVGEFVDIEKAELSTQWAALKCDMMEAN